MNFIIREATENDSIKMGQVITLSWKTAYAGIVPEDYLNNLSFDDRAKTFSNDINKKSDTDYFIAELNGKAIGALVLSKCRDKDLKDAGEVCAMYLLPEYIGKGYGTEMMRFSVSFLAKSGFDIISLWVLEDNSRARKFYQKCGFISDGAKKELVIGKPLTALRYKTEIRQ